ncbi:MAG: hypothetical protein IBX45_13655 [Campylobacterales bacterium]|nr:hypothetical protein [Campylobacterales bacterium]
MADFLNYGEKRALLEFDSIFKSQWENGFLPHVRYIQGQNSYHPSANLWSSNHNGLNTSLHYKTSSITQPPLVGYMFELCLKKSKNKTDFLNGLKKYIPQLHKYHKYLFTHRNYENCIYILHPWESGLDNSPVFDAPGKNAKNLLIKGGFKNLLLNRLDTKNVNAKERPSNKDYELYGLLMDFINRPQNHMEKLPPFAFIDVVFNSIYVKSLSSLQYILGMCKEYRITIDDYDVILKQTDNFLLSTLQGVTKKLYSDTDGCFYCYDIVSNRSIELKTIHNFFPLILKEHLSLEKINKLTKKFKSYIEGDDTSPVPTNMDQESFNPHNYWRGPVWPIINWFFIEAFNEKEFKLYAFLKKQTIALISEGLGCPQEKIRQLALNLLEFNSYDDYFTTPSKQQYYHGWLWDSCFAALGWIHANNINETFYGTWEDIYSQRVLLKSKSYNTSKIKNLLRKKYSVPMFSEYYASMSDENYPKDAPLGADMMTWTASVYLDLIHKDKNETNQY